MHHTVQTVLFLNRSWNLCAIHQYLKRKGKKKAVHISSITIVAHPYVTEEIVWMLKMNYWSMATRAAGAVPDHPTTQCLPCDSIYESYCKQTHYFCHCSGEISPTLFDFQLARDLMHTASTLAQWVLASSEKNSLLKFQLLMDLVYTASTLGGQVLASSQEKFLYLCDFQLLMALQKDLMMRLFCFCYTSFAGRSQSWGMHFSLWEKFC